jgi:hypothetical protein
VRVSSLRVRARWYSPSSRRSPTGAEAMNTGIQDGVNLAWKLAVAVRGAAAGGAAAQWPQGVGELPPLGNDIVYANGHLDGLAERLTIAVMSSGVGPTRLHASSSQQV